jgi:HEPN domain-containing protein
VLGHSLVSLVESLRPDLPEVASLRAAAAELDLHYVPARYPNALPDLAPYQAYTREQADRAIAAAARFIEIARTALR